MILTHWAGDSSGSFLWRGEARFSFWNCIISVKCQLPLLTIYSPYYLAMRTPARWGQTHSKHPTDSNYIKKRKTDTMGWKRRRRVRRWASPKDSLPLPLLLCSVTLESSLLRFLSVWEKYSVYFLHSVGRPWGTDLGNVFAFPNIEYVC